MKRTLLAALLIATPAAAQAPVAPEHTIQACTDTLGDMTRAFVATRAALNAAQARIADLEREKAPKRD
jgi:hypothetical protein